MLDIVQPALHVPALGDGIEQFGECSFARVVQSAVDRHLDQLQMTRFEIVAVIRGPQDFACPITGVVNFVNFQVSPPPQCRGFVQLKIAEHRKTGDLRKSIGVDRDFDGLVLEIAIAIAVRQQAQLLIPAAGQGRRGRLVLVEAAQHGEIEKDAKVFPRDLPIF